MRKVLMVGIGINPHLAMQNQQFQHSMEMIFPY
jgi:hypothetical protein